MAIILVVDDEVGIRELLSEILIDEGYDVRLAENAAAARRIPLVTVGLIQFITPMLQLLVGVTLLGEHVSGRLWFGFGIVWVALALLTFDSLRAARAARAGRREPPVEPCP